MGKEKRFATGERLVEWFVEQKPNYRRIMEKERSGYHILNLDEIKPNQMYLVTMDEPDHISVSIEKLEELQFEDD